MPSSAFDIAGRPVGLDHPPYVIAEAGVHHFNSVSVAKQLILEARWAGADAIKFQTYTASRIAARWAPTYWEDESGRTQFDIFAERSNLTTDDYAALFAFAAEVGITLLSTPFDVDAAAMLDEMGMAAYKIASADITNVPLLRKVASFGKPVLLSTGASTLEEVENAVAVVEGFGVPVAVLHCTLTYPTPLAEANLQRIAALRGAFPRHVVGYSDHTQPQDSEFACPLSVALGARVIEKHYTLNKALPEDDHYHAVDQGGLIRLVRECRNAYAMTSGYREMTEGEQAARRFARRSIVAARDLAPGTVISQDDIDFKRPGTGLSPTEIDRVLGRRLRVPLNEDQLLQFDDLDP